MSRRVAIRELEETPWPKRLLAIRYPDSQAQFAARTGFSLRQVKRWEKGAHPTEMSARDLEAATGYPARLFLPPPAPTLADLDAKLDLVLSLLQSRNGRRR